MSILLKICTVIRPNIRIFMQHFSFLINITQMFIDQTCLCMNEHLFLNQILFRPFPLFVDAVQKTKPFYVVKNVSIRVELPLATIKKPITFIE
ncbi:hypothetical protein TRIATDRAFT_298333 [Trichoderma atroviride IMI 206040]|uniref:Uncharacterized protein n=1 Tax=Hypocrea atroviridis (strain ATCC 20476 / IMI 206040) TaxID=452589 RepID=G9NMK5_HYPAI|nr:uncharacterized protein TRIATDRAFT_298333 [Trichoderma atroviride IMI 206040]EHK48135.1 hypothetical protein TRIATDRAFT_298333 [Trichoderma atroviride IMI 206040]